MRNNITVKYDGEYPNLCRGNLVIIVNNDEYDFGQYNLSSGGSAYFTNNYSKKHVTHGPWSVSEWPKNFPEYLKEEVLDAINNQISHGCCGGCL